MTFTEAKERAKAFGVYGAISGGGAAIGLLLGGVLTEYASWRWCLFVNIPIAILAAALAVPFVHESKADGDTRYDIPGAVTATLGLVALVYGFTKVGELKPGSGVTGPPEVNGWLSSQAWPYYLLAVVLLGAFVLVERRAEPPAAAAAGDPRPQPWRRRT